MSSSPAGPCRITRAPLVELDLGQPSFQPQDLARLHVAAGLLVLAGPPAILGIDQPGDVAAAMARRAAQRSPARRPDPDCQPARPRADHQKHDARGGDSKPPASSEISTATVGSVRSRFDGPVARAARAARAPHRPRGPPGSRIGSRYGAESSRRSAAAHARSPAGLLPAGRNPSSSISPEQ